MFENGKNAKKKNINENEKEVESPEENIIKVKQKKMESAGESEKSRNLRNNRIFKHVKNNRNNFGKIKVITTNKDEINSVKITENIHKNDINSNSITFTHSKMISQNISNNTGEENSSLSKEKKYYKNQREAPFLRKYILKLYKGNHSGALPLGLDIKYKSVNNSLSKYNTKYDYENDHNNRDVCMETEIKEIDSKAKDDFFCKNNIENSDKKVGKKLNFFPKKNNKFNTYKKREVNNEEHKDLKAKFKKINNIKKNFNEDKKDFSSIRNHSDLKNDNKKMRHKNISDLDKINNSKSKNNNLMNKDFNSNNYSLGKKKHIKINISPISSSRRNNYYIKLNDGYISDTEIYKTKLNLENIISNKYKSSSNLFDSKDIFYKLINKNKHKSNSNSFNNNIEHSYICLLCKNFYDELLKCPKCDKMFCEQCIRNKTTKNKFCSYCNYYLSNINKYILVKASINPNDKEKKFKNKILVKKKKNKGKENNDIKLNPNMIYSHNNSIINNKKKDVNILLEQINRSNKRNNKISKKNNTNNVLNHFKNNISQKLDNYNKNISNTNTGLQKHRTYIDKSRKEMILGKSCIPNIISKINFIKHDKKEKKENDEKIIYNEDDKKNNYFNINEAGSLGSIKTIITNNENENINNNNLINEENNKINGKKKGKKEEYKNELKIYINDQINKDTNHPNNYNCREELCETHFNQKIIYFCFDCNLKYCNECLKDINENHNNHQLIKYPDEYNSQFQKLVNEYISNMKNNNRSDDDINYYEQKINMYENEKNIFLLKLDLIKFNYINKLNSKIEEIKDIIMKLNEKKNYISKYNNLLKEYLNLYNTNSEEFKEKNNEIINEINTHYKYIQDLNIEKYKKISEFSTINSLFEYISSQYIYSDLVNIKEKRSNALYTEIKFDINYLNKFIGNIQTKKYNNSEEKLEEIISDEELYMDKNLLELTNASFYIKNINDDKILIQLNINLNQSENWSNNINMDYKSICGYILICQKEDNIFELSNKKEKDGILTLYKIVPWDKIINNNDFRYKIILFYNN